MTIKTLPLQNLAVIAVAYQVDEDDMGRPIFDLDILDDAAHERFLSTGIKTPGDRCDCCGHTLKYVCLVEHAPAGAPSEFYSVGRDCARSIETLRKWSAKVEDICLSLAQRAECNAREAGFRKSYPQAVAALEWARTGVNRTAEDIASKLRSFGLSDKQREFLVKLHADDVARRAAATGIAPTGRQTVSGRVVSVKVVESAGFGYRAASVFNIKTVVDLGNGAKVYGNAPSEFLTADSVTGRASCLVPGMMVTFTATFEPSDRDPLFGFWKRPTKWTNK